MPGEIHFQDQCSVCSPGTYSFQWNSTQWKSCMENAVCLGGIEVNINSGYWRASFDSENIIECLNEESCLGGYNENQEMPIFCAEGYTGLLCSECTILDGAKYERTTNFICSKCPDPVLNGIRLVGIGLLICIFLCLLIAINIKKTKESQMSILMRIMTNYLQIIAVALAFNLKFPKILTTIFTPIDKIGNSSESFVSFDCFLRNNELKLFTPSASFFTIFLTGILPFALIILAILIWMILKLVWMKCVNDLKRKIIVTSVSIIFLIHPTIVRAWFSLFQWYDIGGGDNRITLDLNIKCYSDEHNKWIFILGLPMLVLSAGKSIYKLKSKIILSEILIFESHEHWTQIWSYFYILSFLHKTMIIILI